MVHLVLGALPIPVSSFLSWLPSLMNVTPRYLNFLTCFSVAPFTRSTHWSGFLERWSISVLACLFSFWRCCMHLQSYLMRAGGQILCEKAEPKYQQIADDCFCNSNWGTLISLPAFVDPIRVNKEKERWQKAPLPKTNAHMEQLERLWLLVIYQKTNLRSVVKWFNGT